jgi:tetratricopeptide (TPR) repeat protein
MPFSGKSLKNALFSAGALLALLLACSQCAKQTEVPITSRSREARALFADARVAGENLHLDTAMAKLSEAIELDPEFALAYLYRARFTNDPASLQRDLQRAVELSEKVSAGEQMIIKAYDSYYGQNDPGRAVEFYALLVKMFPNDKRTHFRLGVFYRILRMNDEAIAQQKQALAIDENFAPAYLELGYIDLYAENYSEAEESFQNLMRLIPDQPNPYDSMGDLYSRMGKFEEAISYYQQALEKNPDFSDSQLKIGTNLVFLDRFEEGREAVRKAVEMEPQMEGKIQAMGMLCRSYMYECLHEEALAEADEIIKIAADNGIMSQVVLHELAKAAIYAEIREYDEAEQSLREARTILETAEIPSFYQESYSDMLYFWEAAVAARQRDISGALAIAARYMNTLKESHNPDRMRYHMGLLGYIELEREFPDIAVQYFRQADIQEPLFMYYAALAENAGGSRARATRLFRRLASWNTDSLWYAYICKKALARQE